ncbi:MAG: hypothetical protein AB8G15_20015 [Saprospiraceae bacterium]
MTVFKKNSLVLNVSIDGQSLFALTLDDENNNKTTIFNLTQGVILFDHSSTEIAIKQESFPTTGEPFIVEIHNRWPNISYDGNRNLVFAGGIGVGMDFPSRVINPTLEDSYSGGVNMKTYFNYLSEHKLSIHSINGKSIKFRSSVI